MVTLENVLEMWKTDSVIDENDLDNVTIQTSKLHAKYLELFAVAKLQLKSNENKLDVIKKDKWLYFTGKMTQQQMDDKGWAYDPFQGMSKPLKSEMDMYYNSDKDIVKARDLIQYSKTLIETLEEIINSIRWRHQHIKNIIEFRKFTSGI
jgi:hypothetical protein